jgi:hypothetical protein
MKLENFYFIGWPAGRGGKIGKNRKKSGMVNVFSKQVDRQARWSGKTGHEGMVRQGGRPKNQAWKVMKAWLGKVVRLLGQAGKVVRQGRS